MNRIALLIPFALVAVDARPVVAQSKLQVAVVVDVSRSTRGFMEAARQRIESEVVAAMNEPRPKVEAAIWEYGNGSGVRKVLDFTTKPDEFTKALAETCSDAELAGGSEPCGLALEQVRDDLDWSRVTNDQRYILFVGNENFDQQVRVSRNGRQSPKGTVVARGLPTHKVKDRNGDEIPLPIVLNTLHLGPRKEAERHSWDTAAELARGEFENIDGR